MAIQRQQRVITFTMLKGGVGKSTLVIACACEWAKRGRRVRIIDVDVQQQSAADWRRIRHELKEQGHVFDSGPSVISMGEEFVDDFADKTRGYDVVIIDTGAKVGLTTTMALGVSDLAVIPCGPNGIEVSRIARTFEQVQHVQVLRKQLDACILITRKQPRTIVANTARKAYDDAPFDLLETELDLSIEYDAAYNLGLGVTTYNPTGKPAHEVGQLVDELEKRLGMSKRRLRAV